MSSQDLAKKVNDAIIEWMKDGRKLVIAVDGYTGIGKTTLLNNLVIINPDILSVNRDDFLFSRKIMEEKFNHTKDKSKIFEREICDDQKLISLVSAFRNDKKFIMLKVYDETVEQLKN